MERQLRRYIIPNILAMTGTSCYVLADTFFISLAAGADGITALNLVLPLYALIFAIGSMIGTGSATRYALSKSNGDKSADDYFSNSIWCTLLFSSIFAAAGVFFPDKILSLLGADADILDTGLSYTRIVLCFTPFFMLNYTFTAFVRNDSAPKLAMAATLLSGLFNIIFDYILMFPLKMGMAGAALATGISPVISMSVCMIHYISKKNTIVFTKRIPSAKKLISACSLGIAAFIGELSSGITTLVFNFMLLNLSGNTAVAAYGIVANAALVATALFNGVSLGLQPVASSAHGHGDIASERKILRSALKIAICIAFTVVALTYFFTDQLISVFNSEGSAALASYAEAGLHLYFPGFLIAAVNIIKAGFYSAVGKGRESSIIALSRGVFSITVMAFLLPHFLGVTGVWLAFPASELITLAIALTVGRKDRKNAAEQTIFLSMQSK